VNPDLLAREDPEGPRSQGSGKATCLVALLGAAFLAALVWLLA
jgi:hypothetical protein